VLATNSRNLSLKRGLATLFALPLLGLVGWLLLAWNTPAPDIWAHLRAYVLPEAIANTAWLTLGVALIVTPLGVISAWLNAVCDYPGRRVLEAALVLPLALPTYVMAYAWIGLTDFSGPIQSVARLIGLDLRHVLNLSTPLGAALVLGLALFPYVYVPVRASLLVRGWSSFEAARTLGFNPLGAFAKVSVPLMWPAIAAGLSLALMETLADFGAVAILNVPTVTSALFKTWFGLQSLPAAAQLASLLLGAVALLLLLERWAGGRRGYAERPSGGNSRVAVKPLAGILILLGMSGLLLMAFIAPMLQLLSLGLRAIAPINDPQLFRATFSSLGLGLLAALLLAAFALAHNALRLNAKSDRWVRACAFIANLGYALPGVVLALGLLLALLAVERALVQGFGLELLLSSGLVALMLAYVVRFFRVADAPLAAAFAQVRPTLLEQARLYGLTTWQRIARVWLPLLRPGLFSVAILVTVEVIKELPATLMLRPFGVDTLATRVYSLTSEGEWERAAWPALMLVLVGLLPVALLIARSRQADIRAP